MATAEPSILSFTIALQKPMGDIAVAVSRIYFTVYDLDVPTISTKEREAVNRQAEKNIKQLHSMQRHQHAHLLTVNSPANDHIHTWAQADFSQTLYLGADRVKSA